MWKNFDKTLAVLLTVAVPLIWAILINFIFDLLHKARAAVSGKKASCGDGTGENL